MKKTKWSKMALLIGIVSTIIISGCLIGITTYLIFSTDLKENEIEPSLIEYVPLVISNDPQITEESIHVFLK